VKKFTRFFTSLSAVSMIS